jgi:hypothetical protein
MMDDEGGEEGSHKDSLLLFSLSTNTSTPRKIDVVSTPLI